MDPTNDAVSNGFAQRYTNILQTMVVISIAIAGMWGAVILPLEQQLQGIRNDQKDLVTIREYDEFKRRSDSVDLNNGLRIDKTINDVDDLRVSSVSKEQYAAIRSDIDKFQQLFGGQYTISDKVKDLQAQIEQIRLNGKPK